LSGARRPKPFCINAQNGCSLRNGWYGKAPQRAGGRAIFFGGSVGLIFPFVHGATCGAAVGAGSDWRSVIDGLRPYTWLHTIGAPPKGVLWETTGVRELRVQARSLAERLLGVSCRVMRDS
jgi:hypothetical protein